MSASTYIKPYFIGNEDIQRIDFDHGVNEDILRYVYGSDNPNGDLLNNFDKGEDFSIVFSKCYTEKLANILVMARALYRVFNSVENCTWTENEDKKANLVDKSAKTICFLHIRFLKSKVEYLFCKLAY